MPSPQKTLRGTLYEQRYRPAGSGNRTGKWQSYFENVELGCDYGDNVEIVSGLISDEAVILHPPDS
jgi:hypothetical protein